MDERSAARIRVFLNDPAGQGEAPVPSIPPLDTERSPWGFRVEGSPPAPAEYPPDTPEFLHWQMAAALERSRALWARLLPEAGEWVPGLVLPAFPIAGEGLNAFYDRRALRFFRGENPATGQVVHAGDSPDIVAHEGGHAVLDAVRPDLWDAPHFEAAAFHEAFGDLASILVAFDEPALVRAVLGETRGELARSNLVSRVAEELGAAAHARYGPGVALPDALRDAVNTFAYSDPTGLPTSAPPESLSAEPHSFCRVLTGACWDVLVALYTAAGGGEGIPSGDEGALARAAHQTGLLFTEAALRAPVGADFFQRITRRMVRAANALGIAKAVEDPLQRRGLALPDGSDEGRPVPILPREGPFPLPGPEGALAPGLIRTILDRLPEEPAGEILLRAPRGEILRGRRRRDLFLHGPEYGPADGAAVEISDSFSLQRTETGYVTASAVTVADTKDEQDARSWVRFLASRGEIAAVEEAADPARLFLLRKSHFVVLEEDGVRRLRRAWVMRGFSRGSRRKEASHAAISDKSRSSFSAEPLGRLCDRPELRSSRQRRARIARCLPGRPRRLHF